MPHLLFTPGFISFYFSLIHSVLGRAASLLWVHVWHAPCLRAIAHAVILSGLQFLQNIHITHSLTSQVFFSVKPSLTTSTWHSLNCPYLLFFFLYIITFWYTTCFTYLLFSVFPTRLLLVFFINKKKYLEQYLTYSKHSKKYLEKEWVKSKMKDELNGFKQSWFVPWSWAFCCLNQIWILLAKKEGRRIITWAVNCVFNNSSYLWVTLYLFLLLPVFISVLEEPMRKVGQVLYCTKKNFASDN